ncbi:hypothetical protein ABZ707_17475 [Streptomyces sp. NPDC006923]|uniref:hypothetical protein n=1 Tax=Streptomyces sp. NPDC006923 TaxID=3155355 RepID=UPI00340E43C6
MPHSPDTPLLTVTGHTLVLAARRHPLPEAPDTRASGAGHLLARLPRRWTGPRPVIMIAGAARRLGRRAVRGAGHG